MIPRVLEPEVMDTVEDARDYDAMDHSAVNRAFAADFLSHCPAPASVLDLGTGTAQIPIELCRRSAQVKVVALDAARAMLELAVANIAAAGFTDRITPTFADAKTLPFADGFFAAVMSNSIVHHIPEPFDCFREMVRVTARGGRLFVRDLLRPDSYAELDHLVATYAGDANPHQRQLFADSLRAALTLAEVRELVGRLGFAADSVTQTSDRHWTWAAVVA